MSARSQAAAVRSGAGLFRLSGPAAGTHARALVEVAGGDRVRWLNGMLSNDVAALVPGPDRSGCYAALLNPRAGVVADLHVLLRPERFWLDLPAARAPAVRAHLDRYIVADDVQLRDTSTDWDRLGLEGPTAAAILRDAGGEGPLPARHGCLEREIAGAACVVASFGWTGEASFQLYAPTGRGEAVAAALVAAGGGRGLVEAGPEALEILRIEAGVPRLGAELDEDVLPDEARLVDAVSTTKGCYTGQEIVARLRSRGRVNHLLVGLRFGELAPEAEPPAPGTALFADGRRVGEITSACRSPAAGAIALGFVRREHSEDGTELDAGGRAARVASLPFVPPRPAGA